MGDKNWWEVYPAYVHFYVVKHSESLTILKKRRSEINALEEYFANYSEEFYFKFMSPGTPQKNIVL